MALKENYKDDILDVSVNTKRKYRMTENADGTVSFEDETEYLQEGDNFGSGAINPIAHAINGLNNYTFNPSGSINLVAYIADDSYYLNEDNKYVLADSPTGQALITSEPSTYKALASDTDLYGIEGEDTVSGFEPSCTPITVGGETLSTIDDKLNYLIDEKGIGKTIILTPLYDSSNTKTDIIVTTYNMGMIPYVQVQGYYSNNPYITDYFEIRPNGSVLKVPIILKRGKWVNREGEILDTSNGNINDYIELNNNAQPLKVGNKMFALVEA